MSFLFRSFQPAVHDFLSSRIIARCEAGKVHGHKHIGAHRLHEINGQIVHKATIDKFFSVSAWRHSEHRLKVAGNRHGGPKCLVEQAAVEHLLLGRNEISRDASKRRGEVIETLHLAIKNGGANR